MGNQRVSELVIAIASLVRWTTVVLTSWRVPALDQSSKGTVPRTNYSFARGGHHARY